MIINFVTGNQGKVRELSSILSKYLDNIELRQLNIDLQEYQGDSEYIVKTIELALDGEQIEPILL